MATITPRPETSSEISASVPNARYPDVLQQFRRLLHSVGYHSCGIAESLEPSIPISRLLHPDSPVTPLNTFLRLFDREESVTSEAASSAFAPLTVAELVEAGFVRERDGRVSSEVCIEPYEDLLLVHPYCHEQENAVMSISASSLELANFTVRARSRRTLDLGTGSGLQAILAATHSDQVYAIDVNPIALECAQFNCIWNGISNVVCKRGNLFEPVIGQKFDLIVTNPPFVISPFVQLRYRDSGVRGDQFCINLAREAASFLNEGGYFQMIFQWIDTAEQGWRERLSLAFSGLGCDAWVMRVATASPDLYVWSWLQDSEEKPLNASSEWHRYLHELETESVSSGLLVLQRASERPNSFWFDESPEDRSRAYGAHIPVLLDARRFVKDQPDSILFDHKLQVSPHLKMIQQACLDGNRGRQGRSDADISSSGWSLAAAEFRLEEGPRYFYDDVDTVLASLVAGCDGKHKLARIFEAVAAENEVPLADLKAKYSGQIRELLQYGFLRSVPSE
ncbi:MAG: class I SAM-dependent methyltransferase [Acidobacteriaceae bacterium]|nr:class I SAM-dependent methyltransferase [Acidobacteriaceae bacterium]